MALGAAIGTCFGILVPIGQIPLAVLAATLCRANLPAAILGTFVTNGFTYVPIYALAYWLGCVLTGAEVLPPGVGASSWREFGAVLAALWNTTQPWTTLGLPLLVGVVALSGLAALVSYLGVLATWTLHVRRAWSRRRSRVDA